MGSKAQVKRFLAFLNALNRRPLLLVQPCVDAIHTHSDLVCLTFSDILSGKLPSCVYNWATLRNYLFFNLMLCILRKGRSKTSFCTSGSQLLHKKGRNTAHLQNLFHYILFTHNFKCYRNLVKYHAFLFLL